MYVGQSIARVDRQVCWSVQQLRQVGRYGFYQIAGVSRQICYSVEQLW